MLFRSDFGSGAGRGADTNIRDVRDSPLNLYRLLTAMRASHSPGTHARPQIHPTSFVLFPSDMAYYSTIRRPLGTSNCVRGCPTSLARSTSYGSFHNLVLFAGSFPRAIVTTLYLMKRRLPRTANTTSTEKIVALRHCSSLTHVPIAQLA